MMVAGDELSRTQGGNNNAYCQDNEISWINWQEADKDLLAYTQKLIHFAKKHPVFNRRRWFKGEPVKGIGLEDIAWFQPDGEEMSEDNWNHDFAKSLAVYLNGLGIHSVGWKGEKIFDDSFFVIFNAHYEELEFKLPAAKYGKQWMKVIDTAKNIVAQETETYKPLDTIVVDGRSIVVLQYHISEQEKRALFH